MSYTIYGIHNLITKHWYIGQSSNYDNRQKDHITKLRTKTHINPKLQYAFDRYGEDAFKFIVLAECDTLDESLKLECQYVAYYNSFYDGYNQTTGGDNREFSFIPCEWNGVQYESISHAAKALNLPFPTMQGRVAKGYKSDKDLKLRKPVTWNGINYPSVTEAAKATGYSEFQMSKYTRRGYSSDEDVNAPRPRKKPRYVRPEIIPNAVKMVWNNVEYESIGLAAKTNNMPYTTMRRYFERGYVQDSDVPPSTRHVLWNNVEYDTLQDAANAIGVTRKTMRTYLDKGYTCDADMKRIRKR